MRVVRGRGVAGRHAGSGREGVAAPPAANPPRRWVADDIDAVGEPVEVAEKVRRPARFYAPPGDCPFCDRRRRAAAKSMRTIRERGGGDA